MILLQKKMKSDDGIKIVYLESPDKSWLCPLEIPFCGTDIRTPASHNKLLQPA